MKKFSILAALVACQVDPLLTSAIETISRNKPLLDISTHSTSLLDTISAEHSANIESIGLGTKAEKFVSSLESIPERPEKSIARPITVLEKQESGKQGNAGACHAFATQTMVRDATGLKLSTKSIFLDHLLRFAPFGINPTQQVLSMNLAWTDRQRLIKDYLPHLLGNECGKFESWEAGSFENDFKMIQKQGAIIAKDQSDFDQLQEMIAKIDGERELQIKSAVPLSRMNQARRLLEAGIGSLVEQASVKIDPITGRNFQIEREMVKMATKDFKVVNIHLSKSHKTAITQIVNALEKSAVFLAVEPTVYRNALMGKIVRFPAHPEEYGHGIVVLAYNHEKNEFLVRDGNFPTLLKVGTDLLQRSLSRPSATILVRS